MPEDAEALVFELRGDGMHLVYRPSAGTLQVGQDDGTRTYEGDEVDTTADAFAVLVTVCTLPSDRSGHRYFLTLALPRGPVSDEDDTVQGMVISSIRWDLHEPATTRRQVTPVSGTARSDG